jgi:hypothetical protein
MKNSSMYCDMTSERQNNGRGHCQATASKRVFSAKHVTTATDAHAAIEDFLEEKRVKLGGGEA